LFREPQHEVGISDRKSAIGNRQSAIGNRQSAIGNLKSQIHVRPENRPPPAAQESRVRIRDADFGF
jgi:hypothetical protein